MKNRRAWAMLILAALAGLIFWRETFEPALRGVTHGFPVYYVSARLIHEGRWSPNVYDNDWFSAQALALTQGHIGEIFSPNPPSASLLMAPFAGLDIAGARAAWIGLNLLLLAASLALIVAALPQARGLSFRAGFVAFALAYAPMRENFRLGQAYVLLLFLFALAFWSLSRSRWAPAGIALGTAALAKLSGGVVWLMLASHARWQVIRAGALAGVAFFLASVALTGWGSWERFLSILPEYLVGNQWSTVTAFQTTPSFFRHLFVADVQLNPQPLWHQPWLAFALSVGIGVAVLALTLGYGRRADDELAFAAATTLSVILLPLAEEYHYTLLLLPLAVMASRMARKPLQARDVAWLVLAVLLLAAPLPYKSPQLNDGWYALLAYPRLYGGWLVWGWLFKRMAQPPNALGSQLCHRAVF